MKNPRKLEPFFSYWMNRLTEDNLHDKGDIAIQLAEMSKAIYGIAHWLSASLDQDVCDEYRDACEAIFEIDLEFLRSYNESIANSIQEPLR